MREVAAEQLETVKLTNLVPPIHFDVGVAEIPDSTVAELRDILESMRDRRNVRLHLVGHADTQPLSPGLARVFGDNEGLSRERAGEVAELLQRTLGLPAEGVSYEWAGDQQPVASNATEAGRAQNRRVEVEVWYDEVKQGTALDEVLVAERLPAGQGLPHGDRLPLRYVDGNERRTRVQNVVAPLRFGEEAVEVTPGYVEQIRQAVANLSDRHNVLVKFIGYTDDAPLTERNERIYGNHAGLSRAQARRVALAVQEELRSGRPSAVDSDGRGTVRPLGSNATAQGRALNRRVEVEFWYDDPLQELPDEPQLCPAPGTEMVTRVYDPPWGALPELAVENGAPVVPAGLAGLLRRGLADVAGQDQRASALRRLHEQRAPRAPHRRSSTATTSVFRPRARGARWRRSPPTCSSRPRKPSSRAAATCIPTTSSTRASSKARRRTSPCRSSTTSSRSSTTTKASTSRR